MHFHVPPVSSTVRLVNQAPLEKLETGTRTAVEIIGYPEGQFRLVTSVIEGPRSSRSIRQHDFSDVPRCQRAERRTRPTRRSCCGRDLGH
jgi:hypothetical protein